MANRNEQVFIDLQESLNIAWERASSVQSMKKLGKDMITQIRKRTRLGSGVNITTGKKEKLTKLSSSYKEVRKGNMYFFRKKGVSSAIPVKTKGKGKRNKNLSMLTTPSKSNLTATGQLLDSMKSRSFNSKIIISFNETRFKELSGKKSKLSNSEVARHVRNNGRNFLNLANFELSKFSRELRIKILRSFNNK